MKIFSSSRSLTDYQWVLISRLCRRGYSVREALDTLRRTYPRDEKVIRLCDGLVRGQKLTDLIGSGEFEKRLIFYSGYLPLGKAIEVVNSQLEKERKLRRELTGKIGYQALLAAAALGILFLFSGIVLPGMMASMDMTEGKASSLSDTFHNLAVLRNILAALAVFVTAMIVSVRVTHSEKYIWMFLHQKKLDGAIRSVVTYRLARKLDTLLEAGISFVEAVDILRKQDDDQLVKLLAYHFDETLKEGVSFENSLSMSFFDGEFYYLCVMGIRNDDFRQSLNDYCSMMEIRWERLLKSTFTAIQTVSYLFVAAVIILAYQVLLLPLELLEQF